MSELPLKLTDKEKAIEGVEELHPMITEAFNIKDTLLSLEIENDQDFDIASAKATDAKKLIKKIDAKRKLMTAPLDEEKKAIMDLVKRMTGPISDGIEDITLKITKFAEIQEKAAAEKVQKLEEKKDGLADWKIKLKKLENKIYNSIDKYDTVDELNSMFQTAIKNKKGTGALQVLEEGAQSKDVSELAAMTLKRVKGYGKLKVENIKAKKEVNDMTKEREKLMEEMNADYMIATNTEAVTINTEIEKTKNSKSSNIRKNVKYRVTNMNDVDPKYKITTLSDVKVKEFIKSMKDKEGFLNTIESNPDKIINGLEFYIERTHVGR